MPRVFKDYYQILGVSHQADARTIRAAYRRLARKYHPDLNPSPEATRMMQEINEAYQVLSDPARRTMYDTWAAYGRGGQGYSGGAPRQSADADYRRRAAEEYQRQAARRAAEEQRRKAAEAERRRQSAEQDAKEQAEAILRRIEEERRRREAVEAEEEAREQQQREHAEAILRRIEAERLRREQAEATQDDTKEERQKEEAEAVLRKIEEERRRRKEARARQEAAAKRERERAQESLKRIEAERLRRERAEAAQNDERRQKAEAEAVIRKIDAERRRREAVEAEQEAREEWQYEQAGAILRRIEAERLKRGKTEAEQVDAEEQRQQQQAEAVLRKIEAERRRRKESMARQEAAERAERKRAQEILDQIERERFRRKAAERSQAAKRSRAVANPLWRLITRLRLSTRQVTVLVILAIGIGITSLPAIAPGASQAGQYPSPTAFTNTPTPVPVFSDTPVKVLRHPWMQVYKVHAIAWSPADSNSILAASFTHDEYDGSDKEIVIWNIKKDKILHTLKGYGPAFAWSPSNGTVLTAGSEGDIVVLEVWSEKILQRMEGHNGLVTHLAWAQMRRHMAVVYTDSSIGVWPDLQPYSDTNRPSLSLTKEATESVDSVSWSPDGFTLAACWGSDNSEGGIQLWDGPDFEIISNSNYDAPLHTARWSSDYRTVACVEGTNVVLIDTRLLEDPFPVLKGHSGLVEDIAWSPDGTFLASGGQDKRVIIWDILNKQPVQIMSTTSEVTDIEWSSDGNWLAIGSQDGMELWEPQITR